MSKQTTKCGREGPRYWRGGPDDPVADVRPGDWLSRDGDEESWRGFRHQLALRGLAVIGVGKRLFVLPQSITPHASDLQGLAHAAKKDKTGRLVLDDFLEEHIGTIPGLAKLLRESSLDSPDVNAVVEGGKLEATPSRARPLQAATIKRTQVMDLPRRTAKLSKLQRSILAFARDYAAHWRGAPIDQLGKITTASAAARSRAVKRLEGRKLVRVDRRHGRATHVCLTEDGRQTVGDMPENC